MVLTVKGWIHFVPLWRKQVRGELEIPELSIIPQLFTCIITSFFLLTFFPSVWLNQILIRLELTPSFLLKLLSSPFLNVSMGIIISVVSLVTFLYLSEEFGTRSFSGLLRVYRQTTLGSNHEALVDMFFGLGLGIVTGILYSLVIFIPVYITGLFTFFFFISLFWIDIAFLLSSFISIWFMVSILFIFRGKLVPPQHVEETIREYPITDRVKEIMESDEEPVVCESCRSLFAAERRNCPVCGESRFN